MNLKNEIKLNEQNIEFFSSYLKEKQLNYFYVTSKNNSDDNINFLEFIKPDTDDLDELKTFSLLKLDRKFFRKGF